MDNRVYFSRLRPPGVVMSDAPQVDCLTRGERLSGRADDVVCGGVAPPASGGGAHAGWTRT